MITHLHSRSCYTLLNSTLNINNLVNGSKALGYTSVALTDTNVMHGSMEFFKKCKKEGMKPLFGLECTLDIDDMSIQILVLARNNEGYKALLKISSMVSDNMTHLDLETFNLYKSDLVLIVYGEGGIFESMCVHLDENKVMDLALHLQDNLCDFYVALSYQETSYWKIRNQLIKKVVNQVGLKTVALNKIYYLKQEDEESYRILNGIRQQKTVRDHSLLEVVGRYMLSPQQMKEIYDEEDLEMTEQICNMCNVTLEIEKAQLPKFICPHDLEADQYLTQLCLAGLKKRRQTLGIPNEYIERLKYELQVIISMKFENYFLIVWDFIRYAKSKQIYVGPGRGSAAGSLVSYCLGITHLDPIEYGLMFERFLNPERISMPDIDVDFPDNRRDEVIEYVREKYGVNHTAHIATFGTLGAKQVLRDVGRVMDIPLSKVDMLCKAVPNALKMNLDRAMSESPRFNQLVNSSPSLIKLFEVSRRIEGLPRHVSMHAAGIVFSHQDLEEVVPTLSFSDDIKLTQYTMEYLEELGLIKMDFLGLRNLSIIDDIVQVIKKSKPDFDILKIPTDDIKTFNCIKEADTVGVFQLESDGMKSLIKRMKPSCFDDIALVIALYRPGPMENIGQFLEYKKNPEKINYYHPVLKPILESTYGTIIYQEQIMQIAQVMAGFSLSKADILRKAMSKKVASELLTLQCDFVQGCINNGYEESLAKYIYELILKFANYGFNKSHSVAYGLIAYQMAYLKANVPLIFFKSLLSSVLGSESKTCEYIDECRRRGVSVLQPSINHSVAQSSIEGIHIRLGLMTIKNVGESATKTILIERVERGEFKSFYDFVARILTHRFSQKIIECLIDAGALDEFKVNRASLRASLSEAISYANLVRIEIDGQSRIDFGLVSEPIMMSLKENTIERSEREKAVLGFYFSSHPILMIKKANNIQTENIAVLKTKMGYIKGFGLIQKVKMHRTKHGDTMAFVNIADESGDFDLVFMPKTYSRFQDYLIKGVYLSYEGKKDKEDSCIVQVCAKIEI